MNDLTLLYYTANRIEERFADAVRASLVDVKGRIALVTRDPGIPHVISVSQRSINFGDNYCVGEIGASIYNCYRQVLIAATAATTPFVACCEDDSLYVPEHFAYRPAPDVFAYNRNRWVITRRLSADGKSRTAFYYWRERTQLAMLVCRRELLIETLEERFAKFPEPIDHETAKKAGWGEPGRYERNLGLTARRRMYFTTTEPCVTFNHTASLMGRRAVQETDIVRQDLPPWGDADALWSRIYG